MNILLDAAVWEMPLTGVGKAALLTYQHALQQRPELQVTALHRKNLKCAPPPGMISRQRGGIFPSKLWRRYVLPFTARGIAPDAIHFPWNGNIPPLPFDYKIITTLHDVLPLTIPKFFAESSEEEAYRQRVQSDVHRTDLLLTDSNFSKQEILKHFKPRTEPVVLYLAATLNKVAERQENTEHPYFLYVGGYDRRKGLDALLRIFLGLRRDRKLSSKLVLTGSQHYYSEEFRKLVAAGVAGGPVVERGYVTDDELAKLLSGALALVYPSRYEGFGLPPLEAMALGCPVITTRETSLGEVCGDAAAYIHPEREQEFAETLIQVEQDAEFRRELSAEGLKQASNFSWQKTGAQFLKELDRITR
jgi:glycosyltransferase involved in cell wall biosynthesis